MDEEKNTTALLELSGVQINRGGNKVLAGVNFSANAGEIIYVFGGNGSGKTTLLECIMGFIPQEKGEIKLAGEVSTSRAKYFAYVPQVSASRRDFPLSVREMIMLECHNGDHLCEVDPVEHLKLLGAESLVDKNIADLSGGEYQKVLIARALVSSPKILVLDEPQNNLDEASQVKLLELIEDYSKKGNLVFFVSHDFNVVFHDKDTRVLLVNEGQVVETDEESLVHENTILAQHIH